MNVQILIQEKLSDFEGRTVDDEEVEGIRYSSAVILLKKCRQRLGGPRCYTINIGRSHAVHFIELPLACVRENSSAQQRQN